MFRIHKLPITAVTLFLLAAPAALGDERYNPVKDEVVSKGCGAYHMAFQPQMLPERSWEKIMNELSDHFGEDASLGSRT